MHYSSMNFFGKMFEEISVYWELVFAADGWKNRKIRTNKNFVPHGNLQFCLSFVIFPILMTNTGKRDILMAKVRQK